MFETSAHFHNTSNWFDKEAGNEPADQCSLRTMRKESIPHTVIDRSTGIQVLYAYTSQTTYLIDTIWFIFFSETYPATATITSTFHALHDQISWTIPPLSLQSQPIPLDHAFSDIIPLSFRWKH